MNYTYFYKHKYHDPSELNGLLRYDVLLAGYVNSHRVQDPVTHIPSDRTIWFAIDSEDKDLFLSDKEVVFVKVNDDYNPILDKLRELSLPDKRVCLDCTGFRIPHLLFVMRCMMMLRVNKFDIIYTETPQYNNNEDTQFSDLLCEVKLMYGMSGIHTSRDDNDLLVIAAGYDNSRISDVANSKKHTKKTLMLGFPSISPGMFQENILRAHEAEGALDSDCFKVMAANIYAPAYDPFVAAQEISDYIEKLNRYKPITNIYLSPLSTKPHAIGMALYFLWESGFRKNISLIYPYCKRYITANSDEAGRIWRYEIELPAV